MNDTRADILLIQVDQLPSRALRAYGGSSDTPNIDSLFERGVAFSSNTVQCPLCQPSRASLWSGIYPHRTEVLSNGRTWPCPIFTEDLPTLGEVFTEGGYKAIHFGKRHDSGALRGFELVEEEETFVPDEHPAWPYNFDTYNDQYTTDRAVEFFSSYAEEKPLLAVVDLINPHNICGWVGKNEGVHTDVAVDSLPSLPPNFVFDDIGNRSKSIQYICCAHIRQAQASLWDEENFRHYLAAYNHYLSLVDRQVGRVLDALKQRGTHDDTIIVFFSDHGDGLAARGTVTKHTAMYQELVQVPLVFCGGTIVPREEMVGGLAQSLDLAPTLCELAGIAIPASFDGTSLLPSLETGIFPEREYAVSQWHTEWGYTVEPCRMIRTNSFKYLHYLEDDFEEFFDLDSDPYEMTNVAKNPQYEQELKGHRRLFEQYLKETNDPYRTLMAKADPRWREHEVGYYRHRGITAPQAVL
ncbi:MAG: sulfatase-like hydrolase/transferase [Sphaerochaeta sp.]|nr:sulfatase-like hydrolase/transferase [Sphaerochaeta sp.]